MCKPVEDLRHVVRQAPPTDEEKATWWARLPLATFSHILACVLPACSATPAREAALLSWRGQSAAEPRVALLYLNPNQIYHQVALSHTQDVEPLA